MAAQVARTVEKNPGIVSLVLIILGAWTAVSIPLALLVGAALGADTHLTGHKTRPEQDDLPAPAPVDRLIHAASR